MSTATGILVTLPRDGKGCRLQLDVSDFRDEEKVPAPKYRHAAPSAPWPWMDFNQDGAHVPPLSPGPREPWERYPQSHFGNWTPDQVNRCRMLTICNGQYMCQIHKVDVLKNGKFDKPDEQAHTRQIPSEPTQAKEFWDDLQSPLDPKLRVRALFIEDMTLNVLQMLGARYNIEPFFFASSANWIPSRYQEDPHLGKGDHITVVLPFIRTVNNQEERISPTPSDGPAPITDTKQTIDTQAPLVLSTEKILLQDLLAIHMVRSTKENIIISYHHHSKLQKTTARLLQSLVQRTGDSVYWQKLYGKSEDPTFVFLAILWYALYAWDEALEVLYEHLSEKLESSDATTHIKYARELHKLQAHLLYYQQLLRDFTKSVEFVRDTGNPAMYHEVTSDEGRKKKIEESQKLLEQESNTLLTEIKRLEKQRKIQSDRLQNVIHLSFATVNIEDSRSMKDLTKATMRDSAAMKQISYLAMIFLPANYLSTVFRMNVAEIHPGTLESLSTYVVTTVILTGVTAWVVIALQEHSSFHSGGGHIVRRFTWPLFYIYTLMQRMVKAVKSRARRKVTA